MKTKLTFLLSLTFLFLFSENSFGIDFGKSEEEKFKGTNIGIHICSQINMDITERGFQCGQVGGYQCLNKVRIEKNLIRKKCTKKHEKIVEPRDWLKLVNPKYEEQQFGGGYQLLLDIENNSTNKLLTSISIVINYKDSSRESDQRYKTATDVYVLPNSSGRLVFYTDATEKDTKKGNWSLEIRDAWYVDFVLK